MGQTPKAILIAGATASGKSQLALALARRVGGIVINADSMQVYGELEILTARPGAADLAAAPHRLYGHVSARDPYSVARWLEELKAELAAAHAQGVVPIVVGGTGMFLTAATEGLADIPAIPAAVRAGVRGRLKRDGAAALHAALTCLDPATAARLRPTDSQRIARALEVFEGTGVSLATWQTQGAVPLLPLDQTHAFVLDPGRPELNRRIDARFDAMVAGGALDEARRFAAGGFDPASPAAKALGLRPLIEVAEGRRPLEEAVALGKIQSRQYAKRQATWFRNKMIAWNVITAQFLERMTEEIFSIMAQKG